MNNYVKLQNNLESLGLFEFKNNLDKYIEYIQNDQKTVVDALYELSEHELSLREKRAMNACVKVASFPFLKTFDDFDFSFQPSINKEEIINFKYHVFFASVCLYKTYRIFRFPFSYRFIFYLDTVLSENLNTKKDLEITPNPFLLTA